MKKRNSVFFIAALSAALSFGAVDDAAKMGAEKMNPGSAMRTVERMGGGEFKVLVYGNSIALHGPLAKIGWTNNWGMAASAREKDFAHLLVADLEAKRGEKADLRIRNLASLERNFKVDLSDFAELAEDVAWAPDYVVIAIGENAKNLDDESKPIYKDFLVSLARPLVNCASKPLVVMRSPFLISSMEYDAPLRSFTILSSSFLEPISHFFPPCP